MKRLSFALLILYSFTACYNPSATPPTAITGDLPSATLFPTTTPVPALPYPISLEVISPDNIDRLEEIDVWGEGNIYSVALSPDEETIAVYTATGIHLYDSKTLIKTQSLDSFDPHAHKSPPPIAFSPDGKYLAYFEGEAAIFLNLSTSHREKKIFSLIEEYEPSRIEFSPESNHIVVTALGYNSPCDNSGINFALYNLKGHLLFDRYFCNFYADHYYRLTTDGKLYIFFKSRMIILVPLELNVVDLDTGSLIESASYDPEDYDPQDLFYDVSPDGKLLASSEFKDSVGITKILDAQTREVLQVIDGKIEFYVNENGEVVWRDRDWLYTQEYYMNEKCEIKHHDIDEYKIVFSFENKVVLSFSHFRDIDTLELWNLSTCDVENAISFSSAEETAFSPDGKYLASSNGYNLYVWDMKTGQDHFTVYGLPFEGPVDIFAFNRDGARLITSTMGRPWLIPGSIYENYTLSIWDTQSGELLKSLQPKGINLRKVFVTPYRNIIVASDSEGFNFWDIETGELISTIQSGPFTFDTNDDQIWVGVGIKDQQKTITLFNFLTGKIVREIETLYPYIQHIHISEDGKKLAMTVLMENGRWSHVLMMLDIETGEELFRVAGFGRFNYSEDVEKGKTFITVGGMSEIIDIWNYGNESPLFSLPSKGPISPDNKMMVTMQENNLLYFWDLYTGNYLSQKFIGVSPSSITFSPDGRLLAITDPNGLIHLWAVKSNIK